MADPVERVLAGAVEGQAQNPRFIQKQLSKLQAALVNNGAGIREAIKDDKKLTIGEVEIQYSLALEVVASCFKASDFDASMKAEYSLTRGENAPTKTVAYPLAYIEPASYNLFYSTITAVATAVSAGSCVILELPKTLSRTSDVLQKTLSSTLDRDTFTVVDKRLDASRLPASTVRVFGNPAAEARPSRTELVSPSSRVIAVVDRTANMHDTALALLRARFSFAGQSPLAPDLVLVNEFRLKELCSAIATLASKFFAAQLEMNGSAQGSAHKARSSRISSQELDQAGAEVIISGSRGVVARIDGRKSPLLRKKIQEPLLLVHPIRSMDDAIDFANSNSAEPLTGIFSFGTPEVSKYIFQFVNAHLCCASGIPIELLVAPPTPIGYPTSLRGPYSKDMFSIPKPEFIDYGTKETVLSSILDNNDTKQAAQLRKAAEDLDVKVNQPAGHAIGFFEQGIILGGSLLLTTVIAGNVVVWRYGVPALWSSVKHLMAR